MFDAARKEDILTTKEVRAAMTVTGKLSLGGVGIGDGDGDGDGEGFLLIAAAAAGGG
jgi:hypothetical protein